MLKDVNLALQAAHKHNLATPLTSASKSIYEAVCSDGDGQWASKDFSWVKLVLEVNKAKNFLVLRMSG